MADDAVAEIKPSPIPDGPRRRVQASTKLLHEWAEQQHWDGTPIYEARLGPTPLLAGSAEVTPEIAAMLRRANRYADLVGALNGELLVVEAKVILSPDAIGQLLAYLPLVESSPVRDKWPSMPIRGVILCAVDDPHVSNLALTHGIRVIVYQPPWIADYLASKYAR